jgi:hypothetical protein
MPVEIDEEILGKISEMTNGTLPGNQQPEVEGHLCQIDQLEKSKIDVREFSCTKNTDLCRSPDPVILNSGAYIVVEIGNIMIKMRNSYYIMISPVISHTSLLTMVPVRRSVLPVAVQRKRRLRKLGDPSDRNFMLDYSQLRRNSRP